MKRVSRNRVGERGYILLVILFMLALFAIALAAAAPAIGRQIQRQREEETIQRGKQYARAIRFFYRKFGRYPNTIKDLLETNNLRFLRKEYKDPLSDSGEWRLLHPGESQFQPTGFFGKSLTAAPAGAPTIGGPAPAANPNPGTSPTDQSQQPQDAGKAFGSSANNPTFGGGPIVGVAPLEKKQSIIVYNGKDHYSEWEFVYDPRMEQMNVLAGVQVQGPAGSLQQQVQPNQNQPQTPNPAGMPNQVPQ